ncbi:MAG: crotonase/enoyl-CoA hydratase family protein [Vulcanimicrobiaceae bacterium]
MIEKTLEHHDVLLRDDADDGVALLTLNRPAKLNALNFELVDSLVAALREIEGDSSVRAVIITGAGRAFSAGADIVEFRQTVKQGVDVGVREFCRRGQQMTALIESFPKPIVAAVNGIAFGGGCEVVEATHVTIAAASAMFGKPEIKLGMVPTFGGTQRLPRLLGRKAALRAILSGDAFDAQTARVLGLVNEVVDDADVLAAAVSIARSFTRHSAVAVRTCLAAVTRGLNTTIDEGLWIEANQFAVNVASEDLHEGTAAFVEKRTPNWRHR